MSDIDSPSTSTPVGSVTLADLRLWIRAKLRSGNSTIRYTDYDSNVAVGNSDLGDIDYAILSIGHAFVSKTRCTRKSDTASLVADDQEIDLSGIARFRPEFLVEDRALYISESSDYSAIDVECGFEREGLSAIAERRARCGTSSGTPRFIAFTSYTSAIVYPPPKADGTLNLQWSPAFAPALIDLTNQATLVNIPEDLLANVVERMALEVQLNEIETQERQLKLKDYEDWVETCMGKGNFGQTSIERDSVDMHRVRAWR